MKKPIVLLLLIAAAALAAQPATTSKSPQRGKGAAVPRTAPAALTLPAGAQEVEPNKYSYTDPQGKKWIYSRTPFGLVRSSGELVPASKEQGSIRNAAANSDSGDYMQAVDKGDEVEFQRKAPFGVQKWTRKKSELNDFERAAWEKQQQRNSKK